MYQYRIARNVLKLKNSPVLPTGCVLEGSQTGGPAMGTQGDQSLYRLGVRTGQVVERTVWGLNVLFLGGHLLESFQVEPVKTVLLGLG